MRNPVRIRKRNEKDRRLIEHEARGLISLLEPCQGSGHTSGSENGSVLTLSEGVSQDIVLIFISTPAKRDTLGASVRGLCVSS